ncbi:hypothetical protein D3Z36_14610 [Lachnospiraceae bacterium]|nr:hypothetical protein [Lachnospiraceae bacterium]
MIQFKSNMDTNTVEEIFSQIKSRQIAALMFHGQMADYFDFLSLHGYKRLHEYQYFDESATFRKTGRYYINHHGKLLPEAFDGDIRMIPDAWLTANRMSVGKSTKQKAVEDGFNQYHEWESDTKAVYERYAMKLRQMGHEADAIFVDGLVEDVDHELKCLDRIILDLISAGYDMVYIVESQKALHDKYKKMIKEIGR